MPFGQPVLPQRTPRHRRTARACDTTSTPRPWHSLTHSPIGPLTNSGNQSVSRSFSQSVNSLTHSLTHSLAHSLTHSLTPISYSRKPPTHTRLSAVETVVERGVGEEEQAGVVAAHAVAAVVAALLSPRVDALVVGGVERTVAERHALWCGVLPRANETLLLLLLLLLLNSSSFY